MSVPIILWPDHLTLGIGFVSGKKKKKEEEEEKKKTLGNKIIPRFLSAVLSEAENEQKKIANQLRHRSATEPGSKHCSIC